MAMESLLDDHVIARLNDANWGDIYVQLIAFAEFKAGSLTFVKGGGVLPLGRTPKDLVHEAIKKVFSGERKWNPVQDPDLLGYLKSVISSLQDGLIQQAAYQHSDGISAEAYTDLASTEVADYNDCYEALIQIGNDAVAGDDGLEKVKMGLEDNMKSAEIAELFSIPVERVYSLTQKIRRRVSRGMESHPCNKQWKAMRI